MPRFNSRRGSRLNVETRTALPIIIGAIVVIFVAEASRGAGIPHVLIDAALIFCGVLLARFLWGFGRKS